MTAEVFSLSRAVKLSLAALVLGLAALAVSVSVSSEAGSASANGCTWAPGQSGALNCIHVRGSSWNVDSAASAYDPGFHPWPSNYCNRTHQIRFKRAINSYYETSKQTKTTCIFGLAESTAWWNKSWYSKFKGNMANGSSFCGRSKNEKTNFSWSNYACITIRR